MPKASVSRMPDRKPQQLTSPAGVVYSLELVTPATAEAWLARNTANRKLRRAAAERFARDMVNGDWIEDGNGICFAADGTLINGQHRLTAVVLSGTAVWMLVVRNLPMAAQDAMDDGAKRTAGDTFGFHSIEAANTAAAITRRVLMWQNGSRSNTGKGQPTKAEMLAAWREDSTLAIASEAARRMARRKSIPASVIGLTWWLFYGIDPDDCAAFWEQLHTGIGFAGDDSPVYILREQIDSRMSGQQGRVPETEILAWVIKAWNHYRSGKTLSSRYRYSIKPGERFPEPK